MDFTRDSEAPNDLHFWTGVSTIAGALRRRVWIDMRKYQWTPNFYIVFVGPPGVVTKSTVINTGFNLLEKVEGIHFGPESITWQALGKAFEEAIEHIDFVDETGAAQSVQTSPLTISVSELGTFLNLDDSKMVSFLIEMWDSKTRPFKHSTVTSTQLDVRNPWLNIIACTTPSWLKENFPESAIHGGLTSRVIFVYADKKRQLVPYPDEVIKAEDYYQTQKWLTEDLQQIATMSGPFRLSPEARKWGHEWYKQHWEGSRPTEMASSRYEGYLARKQAHIHKLAMVLSAARSNSLVIEREVLAEAEAVLNATEKPMIQAFESIGLVDEARQSMEIIAFVRAHGSLTSAELWRMCQNTMSMKDFKQAIVSLVEAGHLSKIDGNPPKVTLSGHLEKRNAS